MTNKLLDVGPLEMEVLGILNLGSDLAVSDIQTALKKSGHELAYTTVMTVLVRLHSKNMVQRKKEGRQFIYSASNKKATSPFKIFEKVKNSLFGTEKLRPILGLLDSDDGLSRDELEELRRAVDARLRKK